MDAERPEPGQRVLLLAPTARDGAATRRVLASSGIDCAVCVGLDDLCRHMLDGVATVIIPEEVVLSDESDRFARLLREQPVWSDVPVVVLSHAGVESAAVEKAMSTLGNVTLLERPMRVSTLLSVVRAAMRARERQYQVRDHLEDRRRAEADLAASEERFRHLAETIPQLAWMAREDGWIFWYNQRWYEYTGMNAVQMEGWGWQEVHDPVRLPSVLEEWRRSIATGLPFEMEFPLRGADGRFRTFLTRAVPLRDKTGAISLWFGTNTDIEDRRRIADERTQLLDAERAARAEAERANRMKDEFLATLSHELRTPLNAILGWAQILADGARDADELAEGLRAVERNARAQTQIIEDLLDMSRIISGKVRLEVEPVDLALVARSAVETVRPAADAKGIRLDVMLDPISERVSADPSRMQQVLWNLLNNAIKFTSRGGRIGIRLERTDASLQVTVTDDGEGIKPEFLPHVFDRFRQSDASAARRYGGLGLGLAIAKNLVEMHGGTIRACSDGVGRGAIFSFSLPLSAAPPTTPTETLAPRRAGKETAATERPSLEEVAVLVVDDEPDAREVVRRLLEDCGARVTTAASAEEALDVLDRQHVDVLVSDIGMPGTDGYELVRRVRSRGHGRQGQVPAAALTAFARAEDRARAMAAGYQKHLVKPVESLELLAAVASLAGKGT